MPLRTRHYELHGAGRIPFPRPLPNASGGIFGGPVSPVERSGIFEDQWALPTDMLHDNTIGGPLDLGTNLSMRAIRASGQPILGLGAPPESGENVPSTGITPTGIFSGAPASNPAMTGGIAGAIVGYMMGSGVTGKQTAALYGGVLGAVASALFHGGRSSLFVTLGLGALAGWLAAKKLV